MAQPRVTSGSGMALFSTRNGKYAQRQAASSMSIVIRSDPAEDRDTMTTRLFDEFPEICKAMTTFTTPQVGDYFDGYDQELHGYEFLKAVLLHIIGINARRARDIQDYVRRWLATNTEAFAMLLAEHTQEHLFTEEDNQEYEKGFLGEAAVQIKRLKEQAYHSGECYYVIESGNVDTYTLVTEATRESTRLREQHDFMAEEHRRFTQFRDQHPPNVPISQNPSASFAPERHHKSARHWSMVADLPSQCNRQQGRLPQPYPHPPFSGMENAYAGPSNQPHIYPESMHPPPSASYNMAIASRGYPGPSDYVPHVRAPISERHQSSNSSKQTKGRRNPVKKSSDDARRASFETDARYQTSSRRRFSQPGAFQFVQSPQSMFSPMQQPSNPSYSLHNPYASTDTSLLGDQPRNRASGSRLPTTQNENSRSLESYTQPSPMIAQMDQLAHGPPLSHRDLPVSSREIPQTGSHASETVQTEIEVDVAQNQGSQNSSDARTLDLNGVGQQIPTIQTSLLGAQSITENLASPSFGPHHGQPRSQDAAQRSSNERARSWDYTFTPGSRIWVGGFPVEFSISAVKSLLGPYCQGLVDITSPHHPNQQYPQRRFGFAFADFGSQQDAEKALDRIPQIQIPNLAERRFLFANWPRTPNKHQQKSKTNWKRNTPQSSPTKNCNNQIMNDPIIEEDGQASLCDQRTPSNAPGNETSVSSEARSGVGTASAPALPPAEPLDARSSTERVSWATTVGSGPKEEIQEMATQTEMTSSGAEPLTGEEDLREAHDVPGDETTKGGAVAWSQSPAKANIDPSPVDGVSDGARTTDAVSSAQKSEDSKPGRRDVTAIPATQAKKANKKQKSKNNRSKSSNTLQRSEGVTTVEGTPKLENIKPPAKPGAKPTEEPFLEEAALPEHEDDVAKPSEAATTESSVSASTRSSRAVIESAIQLSPDSLGVTSHHGETTKLEATEPSQSAEAELPMATALPEDQSHYMKSTLVENKPDVVPDATLKTPIETIRSDVFVLAKTLNQDTELYKQAKSRDNSNTTFDEDGSTSVVPPSTAQTSYFPTERSNSISDEFQLYHSNSTEDVGTSRFQQKPKPALDAATLTRLLQPGPSEQGDYDSTKDSDTQPTSRHAEHPSPKSSSSNGPTEETSMEKPMSGVDESSDSAVGVTSANSKTKQLSSPISPDDEAEKSQLSANASPVEEVSAPVQTRQKKKPKELAVAEEYRYSDDKASLSKSSALPDDQDEDIRSIVTANQADPPIPAEPRTPKQKKNAKKQKKKKAKKTQIPAVEPPSQIPTPDRSKLLPKPETPFQTDGDMSSSVPRTSGRPDRRCGSVSDSSTGHNMASYASTDRTKDSKLHPDGETCPKGFRPGSILTVMPSDSSIVKFSQLDSSADNQEGISSALEEAGYRLNPNPNSSRHFEVKDPVLKLLEQTLQEQERVQDPNIPYSSGAASSDSVVDRVEEFKRQFEMQKLFEQAAAVRRHQAGLPPRTPTNTSSEKQTPTGNLVTVRSLNGDIEKIASGLMYSKALRGERDIVNSVEDRKIEEAKKLLDASPPLDSKGFTYAWLKNATDYIKENQELLSELPPYTPTRNSRTSNSDPSSPSSNSPFRREERQFLGSPTVLDRPGSAIKTNKGSATAIVPLKRGEDPSKIIAEYQANPDAFMGLGRHAQTKPTQSSNPANYRDSTSKVRSTPSISAPLSLQRTGHRTPAQELGKRTLAPRSPIPISPQTEDSRLPSDEREKRIPNPPLLRQSRPSDNNLTSIFKTMKEKVTSEWLRKGQLEKSSLSGGILDGGALGHALGDDSEPPIRGEILSAPMAQANAALGGPHEEDVVASWGNNSGARDSEMQHEAQSEDSDNENGGQCRGRPKELQEPISTTPGAQSLNNKKDGEKQEAEGHVSSPDTVINDKLFTPSSSEDAIGDVDTKLGSLPQEQEKASHVDEVSHSHESQPLLNAEATLSGNATGDEITHSLAPNTDTSESNIGTLENAAQKAEPSTPTTFYFGSEGSAIVTGDDSEIDFPVLPRGHNRSLKGGKSTSPTRGGYAAVLAAKRKEVAKTGKQMGTQPKKVSNGDGWVVTGDEAWGSGRRNSSTKRKESHE